MEVEAHRGLIAASLHAQRALEGKAFVVWRGEEGSRQTCGPRVMMGVEVCRKLIDLLTAATGSISDLCRLMRPRRRSCNPRHIMDGTEQPLAGVFSIH